MAMVLVLYAVFSVVVFGSRNYKTNSSCGGHKEIRRYYRLHIFRESTYEKHVTQPYSTHWSGSFSAISIK